MIPVSASTIALAVGGKLIGQSDLLVTGEAETDSRLIAPGGLFFAKPGEITDGHNFIENAISKGAVLAVVEKPSSAEITQIVVENSVVAIGKLASWLLEELRSRTNIKVIGITGSNGKTTTKNMLREILSQSGETIAPIESYNNRVGAPISILRANEATRFLIVEMGAEGLGSIRYLAEIAKPDLAIILKVGLAHVGEFGGIENTALIKSELAKSLTKGAKLLLNRDDTLVSAMSEKTQADVFWFGLSEEAEYRGKDICLTKTGTAFDFLWPDGSNNLVELQILGEHQVMNALAAGAAADLLGVSHEVVTHSLAQMQLAERWRMQRIVRRDGVTVINDAYNASPDSMRAALQTLAQLGRMGSRTIAVLGEMAELGEYANSEHDALGRLAVRLNIDQLVVVGSGAKLIHMGASQEGSWSGESRYFEGMSEALSYLRGILTSGDTVLVKSSKSANLRFLGDELMEVD